MPQMECERKPSSRRQQRKTQDRDDPFGLDDVDGAGQEKRGFSEQDLRDMDRGHSTADDRDSYERPAPYRDAPSPEDVGDSDSDDFDWKSLSNDTSGPGLPAAGNGNDLGDLDDFNPSDDKAHDDFY